MSTSFVRRAVRVATQVAAASTLIVVAASAQAQPPAGGGGGGGGRGGNRMMAAMLDSLNLSAAQRTKIDSINTAFQAKMPAFTPGQQPSEEDRATRQKLGAERMAAYKTVFTAEQAKKYDDMMAAMRANMGGGRPPASR